MSHGKVLNYRAPADRSRKVREGKTNRGPLPIGQAEHIAGLILETERKQKGNTGSSQTAEAIQRTRARVTLRYFAFERAAHIQHTYRDNGR